MLLHAQSFWNNSSPSVRVVKKEKVEEGGSLEPGEGMGLAARLLAGMRFVSYGKPGMANSIVSHTKCL